VAVEVTGVTLVAVDSVAAVAGQMAAFTYAVDWSLAREAFSALVLLSSRALTAFFVTWETESVLKHEPFVASGTLVLCLSGTLSGYTTDVAHDLLD
jgi:hypothetical protein